MSEAAFFEHYRGEPHFNMAFDEWLLGSAMARPGLVLVRCYTWSDGTLTIGCHQHRQTALDWPKVGATPVIRRVTGGRAVYHDRSELTYAIAINPNTPDLNRLTGSVARTAAFFSEVLRRFLDAQGIGAEVVAQSQPRRRQPDYLHKAPCFDSAARQELVAGRRKIVASAQRQVGGALLQHGSIKLRGLAFHPALGPIGNPGLEGSSGEERRQFDRLSCSFRDIAGEALGVRWRNVELDEVCEQELESLTVEVRKQPLAKRQPVERRALGDCFSRSVRRSGGGEIA